MFRISTFKNFSVVSAIAMVFCSPGSDLSAQDLAKITYNDHVKPILQQHCSSCHSANRKESDLDVTNFTALMQGGGSGEVISPGSTDDSYLYSLVTHSESPEMPPSGKIPDPEIKVIADWIAGGALENAGSKPQKMKAKLDLALSGDALTRPETVVVPLRITVDPIVKTQRPAVNAIAVSPWAKVVAIAAPRQVLLYSTESLELLGILPFAEGVAHQLRFSRNGSLLLGAGGKDGKLGMTVLWDVATGERMAQLGEELDVILAADITAKHDLVAIGGPSKLVKVLSAQDGSVRFEIKKHNDWVTAIEFSPDGKLLATGDRNGAVHVWETATGAEMYTLPGHTAAISGLSFRLDSKILATSSEDTTVRTWEMEKGGAVKNWGAHGGGVTAIQFLRDGNLASCGRDNVCKVWNQDGGVIRQYPNFSDVAVALGYCNETNRLVAADWTGQIAVWNNEGAEVGRLAANPPTLADRLAVTSEALANAMNKFVPAEQELAVSTQKMTELNAAIAAQQQQKEQVLAKLNESKNNLVTAQQKMTALADQQKAFAAEQQQLKTNHPLLVEALEKTTAAAAAMANDAELSLSKTQFETKKQAIEARMSELDTMMPQCAKDMTDMEAQVKLYNANIVQETELVANLEKSLTEMMSGVTPMEQEVAQKTTVFQAVSAEVESAKFQVAKWQGENEFILQLKALNKQLKSVAEMIQTKQLVEQELQAKLSELQNQLDQAREQTQGSERDAESIRQQMLKLRGGAM